MPPTEQEEFEFRLRLENESSKAHAPSHIESLGRGALQGATLGYSDELTGLVESALTDKTYQQSRDESRANNEAAKKAHPYLYGGGEIGGGVGSAILAGPAAAGAKGALAFGGAMGLGNSKADLTKGDVGGAALDTVAGAGMGLLGQQVGERVLSPIVKNAGNKLSSVKDDVASYLREKAGRLAENATGATRVQAEKFAPGAGNELLDRGIVKFGSSPKNIAARAEAAMTSSESVMDDVLHQLDDRGVVATPEKILSELDERIGLLDSNPANAGQARALEKIKEDITRSLGNKAQPLSTVEQWKRGFKKTNWNDPDAALARKGAYRSLMQTTEDVATEASPELAGQFNDAKKTWGLLAPIQEAAEKRNLQLDQHPMLGFKDVVTAAGGAVGGDPTFGLASTIGRRLLAPRIASSGAVTLDQTSKGLSSLGNISQPLANAASSTSMVTIPRVAPQELLQKVAQKDGGNNEISNRPRGPQSIIQKLQNTRYAAPLNEALQRGEDNFSTNYYILQQTDPDFRKLTEDEN